MKEWRPIDVGDEVVERDLSFRGAHAPPPAVSGLAESNLAWRQKFAMARRHRQHARRVRSPDQWNTRCTPTNSASAANTTPSRSESDSSAPAPERLTSLRDFEACRRATARNPARVFSSKSAFRSSLKSVLTTPTAREARARGRAGAIVLRDFHRGVRAGCAPRQSATEVRNLRLHLLRHVHHFIERRRNQPAQPLYPPSSLARRLQNLRRRDHHANR